MNPVRLSIGIDSFRELHQGGFTFVDKSMLIAEVLQSPEKVSLITRPRRFGKTLNLSMIQYFFDCRWREQSSEWFKDLAITNQQELCEKHRGAYPVLSLTLKGLKCANMANFENSFRLLISNLADTHHYLLDSPRLRDAQKTRLQELLDGTATSEQLQYSLLNLTIMLTNHWGKPVVLLIDEYDTPIHHAYNQGFYPPLLDWMRTFLGEVLKGNENLYLSVITGILRASKESLFSGLNHVMSHSVLDDTYEPYFGFTPEEVDQLLADTNLNEVRDDMKRWYNGYRIGSMDLYNPWSIIHVINKRGALKPYWVNTANHDLIQTVLAAASIDIKMAFEDLLQGGTVETPLSEHVVFPDLANDPTHIWYLLLASGYLTVAGCLENQDDTHYKLRIPNLEVKIAYQRLFKLWFARDFGQGHFQSLLEALVRGHEQELQNALSAICRDSLSYFDVSGKQPERVYHAFVLGMSVALQDRYQVRSNRESGLGRYDVALMPKDLTKPGVIIEFKQVDEPGTLEQSVNEALEQVQAKSYQSELAQAGVASVITWGMAFQGKRVLVKCHPQG